MTNQPETTVPAAGNVAARQTLLSDIRVKWNKFTEQEVKDLKTNDDLVTQLVAKYGLEKAAAQRDADTMRAGRNIQAS